ncbi:unnamed protein product [Chironomus riparius]|uniref:L-2-hydroxyglutarate dehydrogenase, mitochondrial n=1 Tax=Chironomus riparius TaxID=315576 RepID=A0A9N9WJ34_9DIPT|nr:unnamed protein product [Chironomus riparius]
MIMLRSALSSGFRCYSTANNAFDLTIVGGGIVGVASAREIINRHPHLKIAIVEKEKKVAVHQSGHNSGVIHAGIYYKPGSLKAKLCVEGLHLAYKYCDEKNIPYKKVGKLIVATNKVEEERLKDLYDRGLKNKVPDLKLVDAKGIKEIEPYCKGVRAIHSPHTGIVDWALVTEYYAKDFQNAGGEIFLNFEVKKFFRSTNNAEHPVTVIAANGEQVYSRYILTCGGLQADKIAALTGNKTPPKIVPFRGEYLLLNPDKAHWVKGNIYPVPDPRFPFLGVHFTPRMDGSIWLGPNAVLAFKREGYTWTDFNLFEFLDAIKYPGLIRMGTRYIGAGIKEITQSLIPALQVRQLQKFIPEITVKDISKGPAGVRAQALRSDGSLVDDFIFEYGEGEIGTRILHCCNAPSPGATSSLSIAKMIADKVESSFRFVKRHD